MSRLDETIQAKKEKRVQLESYGWLAHPYAYTKTHTIAASRAAEGETVATAGRITALRTHGKVVFLDLTDHTASIQVMLRQQELGDQAFARLSVVDVGDFLGVTGQVITSKTGELTVQTAKYEFLGKSLRPLPSEWNAAEDKEVRFRKRYVDMIVNPETKRILDARWLILKEVRRFLEDQHEFIEVETPVLQPLYGGTNAKPFTTHMNALDTDFYLRVAPELYLKRLVVGGYERIFEIARNFRNEGIDQTHQPEFTMIEWYHAYADYHTMMDVAEGLYRHLCTKLYGNTKVMVGDKEIELGNPWPRVTMTDALKKYADIEYESSSDSELKALLAKHKIELKSTFARGKALFALFDELVTPQLFDPIWIIDYPQDISPLAKKHRSKLGMCERFEAYIGGTELADGWSETTDPIFQRELFENEQKNMRAGDDEAHPLDEDFLEAMEHGMPPLGGIGIGIDRLVMFMTNTTSIREVIAFPTLRPLHKVAPPAQKEESKPAAKAPAKKTSTQPSIGTLPDRAVSLKLMESHIQNEGLRTHCLTVGKAMEAYAAKLGQDTELWYQAGLLHDIDWEEFPDEHPNKAVNEWLTEYPQELTDAILAHGPDRTGKEPDTLIERYLFACDELTGFIHAVARLRPTQFQGMTPSSVKKKLKTPAFAAGVHREDIAKGVELIGTSFDDHCAFLISVFEKKAQ